MANGSPKGGHKNDIPFCRKIISFCIGLFFAVLSGFLLHFCAAFEGGAAVTLLIVGLFCSGLYLVFPYVRAVSIGSYVIEFHEVQELMEEINQLKLEASDMLISINSARMNSYRNLLLQLDLNSEMKRSMSLANTHKANLLTALLSSMEDEGVLSDLSEKALFVLEFVLKEHEGNMLEAYRDSGVKAPAELNNSFPDTMKFVVDELKSRNDQPSLLLSSKLEGALAAYYNLTQWEERLRVNQ